MKILHTSDWHLGHRLYEQSQVEEQALFLNWIENYIVDQKIDVLLISGDRHGARGFYIQRPSGYKFYEFEAASLGARVGPPAKNESWTSQLYGIDGKFAFGEFTFNTSPKDPEVTFRLIGDDGEKIYELNLKKSQLTPNKY